MAAAYKTGGKGPYRIGPKRLPGGIEIGRISTGTKDRKLAEAMERAIDDLAVQGWGDLVARLGRGLKLPDLYAAKVNGPDALRALRDMHREMTPEERRDSRPLPEVVERARVYVSDPRARHGLAQLEKYVGEIAGPVTFAWLKVPANLNDLYARARADGRPPNSIRRSLHRAVCNILSHELGRGAMLAILADVNAPAGDDERVVNLTPKQIRTLLDAQDEEMRPLIELLLLTGIDLSPALRLRPMDYDEEAHAILVDDRKTAGRRRSVPLDPAAEAVVRRQMSGREEDESLFGLDRFQVRRRWEAAREAAKLPGLRIKDLRGVFATNYLAAGGSAKNLMTILGHTSMAMTLRYVRRMPSKHHGEMTAAAERMGLGIKRTLKVEKGA